MLSKLLGAAFEPCALHLLEFSHSLTDAIRISRAAKHEKCPASHAAHATPTSKGVDFGSQNHMSIKKTGAVEGVGAGSSLSCRILFAWVCKALKACKKETPPPSKSNKKHSPTLRELWKLEAQQKNSLLMNLPTKMQ
ncbi:hypothetical protein VNO77_03337 [Canavalia gladiata]|uniref:Uncharacterized protein n=1 Tax=Canavalia gladiata TaxID=3824 RepID=A0AAN9MV67_CANGL